MCMPGSVQARAVLKEATTIPPAAKRAKAVEDNGPVQGRLYKHTKLWAFYCDVQESLGTFEETKATYEAMLDLTRYLWRRLRRGTHERARFPCAAAPRAGMRGDI